MNQPYLYDPQANVLRQRAEMNEPEQHPSDYFPGSGISKFWDLKWQWYNKHIAALPAYTPVSGWVPEVGKEYRLNVDFYVKHLAPDTHFESVAVPIEQKQERPLCPECDGDGYVTNGEAPSSEDYRDYTCEACMGCGRVKEKEEPRSFTLSEMIECWEAGAKRTWHDYLDDQVDAPDKKQYFKSKGIDLP